MRHSLLALACAALLCLVACDKKADAPSATTPAATTAAATTATAPTAQIEKLIFAFQPQENPEGMEPSTKKLAEYLSAQIGIPCEVFLPTSYAAVVEALRSENADVAYFSGWPYLIAHNTADVELLVAEERSGKPFYYSQWFVAKDSAYQSLGDLKGKPISFTSPTSTSGYLFPLAKVIEEGHLKTGQDPREFFSDVLYAGGYEASLKALSNGKVEAAAASDYALARYLTPEEQAKIRVLTSQGPAPTHGIAARKALPQEVRDKIKAALLTLNEPEHQGLLKSVYGAERLIERGHDEHVGPLDKAQQLVGADYPMAKKK